MTACRDGGHATAAVLLARTVAPVFAAALSIVVGHDSVTGRLLLGGALILSGNALVELPLWLRDLRGRRPG